MFTRRFILSQPSYWLSEIRLDLMRSVEDYMKAHGLNRRQLADHLACTPAYVSQMLNGDTNVSLEKLCEVALAVGKVPAVKFEELNLVLERDAIQCDTQRDNSFHLSSTISGSAIVTPAKPDRLIRLIQQEDTIYHSN